MVRRGRRGRLRHLLRDREGRGGAGSTWPGHGPGCPHDRARASGDAGGWFVAMLAAGYRGEVRQKEIRAAADPAQHESVREHRDVVRRVRAMLS